MEETSVSEESTMVDVTKLSLDDVRLLDDSVLAHSLRRFRQESEDERDPIVAFGAFNQHGSSPW
jgi:FXSXX-COOH protein